MVTTKEELAIAQQSLIEVVLILICSFSVLHTIALSLSVKCFLVNLDNVLLTSSVD